MTFQKGEVITELTIKNGEASTAADLLPFGRYTIQEVAVGDGYLLTDGKAHEFDISKDGQIVNGVEGAVKNQVKRGDLEFVKPPKGGVYDKTGNMLSGYGWVAALLVVAAVAGAGYAGKQYLDARKEKDGDADGGES